jgi:Tfp pilus assembly protein PilX
MLHASRSERQRGTILLICLIAVFIIAGMSAAMLGQVDANTKLLAAEMERYRAFEVAEAGVAEQMAAIFSGNGPTSTSTTSVGPVNFNGGAYTSQVNAVWGAQADRITVTSTGAFNGITETVSVEFNRSAAAINEAFLKAVYAGNSSEVPAGTSTFPNGQQFNYQVNFSGGVDAHDSNTAFDGDLVNGDIYIAGDVQRTQQARLNGEVKGPGLLALGVAGASQHTRVSSNKYVKPPNLAAMNYDQIADITVKASDFGGSASSGQKNISNTNDPRHIFTLNSSSYGSVNNGTPQPDFYLEDLADGGTQTWNNPISPGVTDKIIYIEGNLYVNHKNVIEFEWAKNTRLTIVVKGNISFGDDIVYNGSSNGSPGDPNSLVAYIALKDPNISDPTQSGNIKLGDFYAGTVDFLHGVMYAERDFVDDNLNSVGAQTFEIFGGMLAGNQVAVQRDWYNSSSKWIYSPTKGNVWSPKGWYHSEMNVQFDNRLLDPTFKAPPGLPSPEGNTAAGSWQFIGWRRGA